MRNRTAQLLGMTLHRHCRRRTNAKSNSVRFVDFRDNLHFSRIA